MSREYSNTRILPGKVLDRCPNHQIGTTSLMPAVANDDKKTLILTGASRGIGHATVKRFSSAGWRVISCSRHPFPEDCPWEMGPEDHIQVDLADVAETEDAILLMKERLKAQGSRLNALVNNAAISPKGPNGSRMGAIQTPTRGLAMGVRGQLFRADFARARAARRAGAGQGRGGERDLDRRRQGASVRGRCLCDVEGGTCRADSRDGA